MSGTTHVAKRFVKIPTEIEAVRFKGLDSIPAIEALVKSSVGDEEFSPLARYDEESLDIVTLNGTVTVPKGEWIVKGVEGEFYPCKNSIFKKTYEPV